jgi:hypothetical protein
MDDDAPELVDVTALPEQEEEEVVSRVPITLVTGIILFSNCYFFSCSCHSD